MTIAACYLSSEGVVFGADNTSTMFVPGPGPGGLGGSDHHYNFAQKIFQIGQQSTLGIAMWGLGNLAAVSYRTLIAQFADQLLAQPAAAMQEVADRWNGFFWNAYTTHLAHIHQRVQALLGQQARSPDEENELRFLVRVFSGGFCLGGYLLNDRTPHAFEIPFGPAQTSPGPVRRLQVGSTSFWGCPNIIERLLFGLDGGLFQAILQSGQWGGTPQQLADLVLPHRLAQPLDLPIREAIDWVYTSIYTTNQAMKFSHLAPVCGGPVEVAVITTDRPFRWVRHKRLDAAIGPHGNIDGS